MSYKCIWDQKLRWVQRATMFALALHLGSLASAGAPGAGSGPEDFRIELTGAAWLLDSSGTIQASGTPIDLRSDLGAGQQQPTFYGRLVVKPGRKHRIVVEGTPFRINGLNTVNRTIVYRGETFNVSETVRSSADLNYLFVGYQYDLVSGPLGHLGLSVGGAYLGATGSITAVQAATTASTTQNIGLPLVGLETRIFPIPGHRILQIEGGARGMGVGDYGHYFEIDGSGGVAFGPFALMAGYRNVNADIHTASSTNPEGVNVRLKGPIFSVQWRW